MDIKIEEEYLEALIKLLNPSGKRLEQQEKRSDKKSKVYDTIVDEFVENCNKAVLAAVGSQKYRQVLSENELAKLFSDEQAISVEGNSLRMAGRFLSNCLKYDFLTIRMNCLVQNLLDFLNYEII